MIPREHRIRRLVCEISLASPAEALVLQQRVGDLCRTALPAELDRMLSAFAGPERLVQIDRIELDLGRLHPDLIEELPARVGAALREELLKRTLSEAGLDEFFSAWEGSSEPGAQLSRSGEGDGEGRGERDGTTVLSEQKAGWEAFMHFLRTGLLPWWAEESGLKLEEKVLELIAANRDDAGALFREEVGTKTVRSRLVHQFSESFLKEVAGLLRPGGSGRSREITTRLLADAERAGLSAPALRELRLSLWQALILTLPEEDSSLREKEEETLILNRAAAFAGQDETVRFIRSAMERFRGEAGSSLISRSEFVQADREPDLRAAEERQEILPDRQSFGRSADAEGRGGAEDALFSALKDTKSESGELTGELEEATACGIPISNAGLVLLWPYLSAFFETCGLLEDGAFRDRQAQEHAVVLLQHLVSGEGSSPEYLLPLNKILCGWDLSETLMRETVITEEERAEAESLLSTAVSHWQALKDTSPEGFRDSFLMREGVLRKGEKGWLLQVERRGYDMLLDRLPWGISMIRLSWMKGALFVEW